MMALPIWNTQTSEADPESVRMPVVRNAVESKQYTPGAGDCPPSSLFVVRLLAAGHGRPLKLVYAVLKLLNAVTAVPSPW